jgi:hypothetical protein
MIAIWPVGPPKLMHPSQSQYLKASARLTFAGGATGPVSDFIRNNS